MVQISRVRIMLVLVALLWGIWFALPNLFTEQQRANLPAPLSKSAVSLGLDLRGGSHLLLEVDTKGLVEEKLENLSDDLGATLANQRAEGGRIGFVGKNVTDGWAQVRLVDVARLPEALARVTVMGTPAVGSTDTASTLEIESTPEGLIRVRPTQRAIEVMGAEARNQSLEVVRRRIDSLGTSEVSIEPQGASRIVVEAPGLADPEALKARIGKTARLTFHLVDYRATAAEAAAGRIPEGAELLPQRGNTFEPYVLVQKRALLSGDNLTDAGVDFDPQNPGVVQVSFRFDPRGAKIFGDVTARNVDKRFAAVLDGDVISAPNINEPILGGSGVITGNFTVEEAQELSALLKAGALPAPLKVLQQGSVGPGLGADSIKAGTIALIIAMVLAVAFMVLAYGFLFGGIAIVALAINFVMIIATMSLIKAGLTLPGVAGLILTLAMAVDANVLIYERMREEQAAGRSPATAIDSGFQRALVTIIDANITTILAAGILFWLGAGPVKGFAWTLIIGVITSVFTAVLVTQVLIAFWFRLARPKRLPI